VPIDFLFNKLASRSVVPQPQKDHKLNRLSLTIFCIAFLGICGINLAGYG
jgi:hypothetical protein